MKNNLDIDTLSFVVFVIENTADKLKISGSESYDLLAKKTNLIDSYIIPHYESLHTQGKEYIVNDIVEKLKENGMMA